MKNVKRFDTESAYNAFINTDAFVRPNISLCADTYSIVYNKILPVSHDYSLDYFTLVALENGSFNIANAWSGEGRAEDLYNSNGGYGIKYSLDNGNTWNNFIEEYDEDEDVIGYTAISVNAGDKMLLKAIRTYWPTESTAPFKIVATGNFNVEGNSMSLIWGDNFIGKTNFLNNYDVPDPNNPNDTDIRGCNAFESLFDENTYLINAENLILPALQLAWNSYTIMFNGCTSLTTAPILPATTLVSSCYEGMFKGCSSLSHITCLATEYEDTYDGISNDLTNACSNWVDGVAVSGTFTKSNGAIWTTGTSGIPEGWTVESV